MQATIYLHTPFFAKSFILSTSLYFLDFLLWIHGALIVQNQGNPFISALNLKFRFIQFKEKAASPKIKNRNHTFSNTKSSVKYAVSYIFLVHFLHGVVCPTPRLLLWSDTTVKPVRKYIRRCRRDTF